MARKPASDTALRRFAALLDGHRSSGTRPATAAGEPWTYAGLAAEIPSSRDEGSFVSPRSVSNWCKGTSLPDEIEPILRALFGSGDRHAEARAELRTAFQAARNEKAAKILAKAKPDPAGGQWVIENEQFVLDRTVRPTDQRAAKDQLRRQLQDAIRRHAADLAERAKRVGNTRTWGRLAEAAALFHAALKGEPREVLQRLGEAYASLLELGSFLETDIRLQKDPARFDEPLDADIHGVLSNLVRTAAPWLRGFPTVARWDDEAGRALLRADLFQPAREFIRINRERQAIPERDAAEIISLTGTAEAEGFQGHKAGTRAVGHATNLLLAEATVVAASRAGSEEAAASSVTTRARATLSAAQAQVEAFSAHWPPDLRLALQAILEDGQDENVISPQSAAVPDDVEQQAAALILRGQSPPAAWRPFIRKLFFALESLSELTPLAGLANLQSLDLQGTEITDIAPLADLASLQGLDLSGTQVTNVAPLAGLASLQSLNVSETQVTDVAPLASLASLQRLDLRGTEVADIAPLASLVSLQTLYMQRTKITDITPLASLASLQTLYMQRTKVTDITPLAGLASLQGLDLRGTQVADIAPLAGLASLQRLDLQRTKVTNVAPLAGLASLQSLNLSETQVTDFAPLTGLASLQRLDLSGTQVIDLAPLASLTRLQELDLSETQVIDIALLAGLARLQELDLRGTQITDITPLAGLADLQRLYMQRTQVTDIAPLAGLASLQRLDLRGTQVTDITALPQRDLKVIYDGLQSANRSVRWQKRSAASATRTG